MPYPIQDLIEGRGELVCVRPIDSVQAALRLMTEHDYSQLPVIDENSRPLGLVTHESILRALGHFGVKIEGLLVAHALVKLEKPDTYTPEDDLHELLNRLKDTNAVLIVDGIRRLIGIVTTYDSTEYLRQRAEDMMLVEDIEATVKDLVLAPFRDERGDVDQERLAIAIEEITISQKSLFRQCQNALRNYLQCEGQVEVEVDEQRLKESFSAAKEKPRKFEDLVLSDYIQLLLHKDRWDFYRPILNLELEAVRRLLDDVRETRNVLAHFRGDITSNQRDKLRFCADWLKLQSVGIPVSWPVPLEVQAQDQLVLLETAQIYAAAGPIEVEIAPTEEPAGPATSRYAPLASWLQSQPGNKIRVSFEEVEKIIGAELPDSARRHRSWWANDAAGHVHARQWLDAGWRVSTLNMATEQVEFFRIEARERAYIDFFTELKREFAELPPFEVKPQSPTGRSWHTVYGLPLEGGQSAILDFAFAAGHRFRVELYIDSGERDKNKAAFDRLYAQKAEIEAAVGEPLSWERIDNRHASRIALYRDGAITDSEEKLEEIRKWAIDAMSRFYEGIAAKADEALRAVSG